MSARLTTEDICHFQLFQLASNLVPEIIPYWVPCNSPETFGRTSEDDDSVEMYHAICQASFNARPAFDSPDESGGPPLLAAQPDKKKSGAKVTPPPDPEDASCLADIPESRRLFEYRYHGDELNNREISCPVSSSYRYLCAEKTICQ